MKLEFTLNNLVAKNYYVGYSPASCTLRITDGNAGDPDQTVSLGNINSQQGGQLIFYNNLNGNASDTLALTLKADGTKVSFFVGGKFKEVSSSDQDGGISFVNNHLTLLSVPFMVRVRKNANDLSTDERNRYLSAFMQFYGTGKYTTFLQRHDEAANDEIHGRPSFLPWHRLFVLDLERHLQKIDPSVTIPYWDFAAVSDKLFSPDFMGVPSATGVNALQFSPGNPLIGYRTPDGQLVRVPRPDWNTSRDKPHIEDINKTLKRGPGFENFRVMEGTAHSDAHVSFSGPIRDITKAPADPIFFLLHSNVDRLWALWQIAGTGQQRFDIANQIAYFYQGKGSRVFNPGAPHIGDYLQDTLWAWNGDKTSPRPPTAPEPGFIDSLFTPYPGKTPAVKDTIDYQGGVSHQSLYYDFYDVPYSKTPAAPAPTFSFAMADPFKHINKLKQDIQAGGASSEQAHSAFLGADSENEMAGSLSDMGQLDSGNAADKAISLLKNDDTGTGLRVLALSRLSLPVAADRDLLLYVLGLVADTEAAPDLRKAAFDALLKASFGSRIFMAIRPEILDKFRGLISDKVQELREEVIAYLARNKDEYVQRALLNGLKDPKTALVSEEKAVHYLGYDLHASIFPILRDVVRKSSNNESRAEAVYLLANDKESAGLLQDVFNNRKERFDIRKNSLLALNVLQPDLFTEIARRTAIDNSESEDIRTISINALAHAPDTDNKAETSFDETLRTIAVQLLATALAAAIRAYLKSRNTAGNQ
jgi:tyrosinase